MVSHYEKDKSNDCFVANSSTSGDEIEGGCCVFKDYLTGDEEKVLSHIRELWKESRKIKSRLKELDSAIKGREIDDDRSGDPGTHGLSGETRERIFHERRQCTRKLEDLRTERKRLEQTRKDANRLKMILLGHIE